MLACGAADRRRDVVELQVQEHPEPFVQQRVDRERPLGGEELQADLDDREEGAQPGGEVDRLVEARDVERQRQPGRAPWRGPLRMS